MIYRLLYSTFHSQWLSSGVKESCYGLSCASRSRIPFSCLLLVSKGCVFRITLHINAFAIVDDSVRYSPFLIIITSVIIPVLLCLHSMCWCARYSDDLVYCWLSSPFCSSPTTTVYCGVLVGLLPKRVIQPTLTTRLAPFIPTARFSCIPVSSTVELPWGRLDRRVLLTSYAFTSFSLL